MGDSTVFSNHELWLMLFSTLLYSIYLFVNHGFDLSLTSNLLFGILKFQCEYIYIILSEICYLYFGQHMLLCM